jgi:hypothetical protein
MRTSPLLVMALLFGPPLAARAQEPVDSTGQPAAADTLALPSDSAPDTADAEPYRPRARAHPAGNPYLREVDQSPARRRGPLWLSLGVGAGGESYAVPSALQPYSDTRIRPTLSIAVGGTVGQQVRLGLEGFAWFNPSHNGVTESVSTLMLGGRFYPSSGTDLYLHLAGGVGRYGQDATDGYCGCSSTLVSDVGLAWSIGGGLELPVGRGLSFGPAVELVRMNVTGPDGYRERVINFGFSLTYDGH